MSVSVTLAELADITFRTPNGCSVNAGALHLLLRGLLEHLSLQDAATHLSEDEKGLLEPEASRRPRVLLPQAEGLPGHPGGPRDTTELLTHGQAPGEPAADTGQMAQLTKRMEVVEEGMTKVMDMLQETLSNTCSLKTTVMTFQEELQLLKDGFQKAGLEELRERAVQQDKDNQLLQNILGQMAEVRRQLSSFPAQTGVLCPLCRVPLGEKLSNRDLIPEASQEPAHEAPCRESWVSERHEAMETCISCQSQLQQHAAVGSSEDVATHLEKMHGEGQDFGREVLSQVGQLQEQCMRLQDAAEQLWGDSEGMQKADVAVLETKASQDELQHAMAQLSEVMQELLQKLSLYDQDRHKTPELISEMDSKRQQAWRLSKQCHCQGPRSDTSSASGFKRPPFDPVKCISCDRPLTMAPRPHLVTVRKANVHLQSRSTRAGGSNCPQLRPARETKGSNRVSQSPPCPTRPPSTSSSLTTVCPFGVPTDLAYKNGQVDILGIDGVIYKGRLNSQATNGTTTLGRDFPGTRSPQPSAHHAADRMRRTKYGSQYVSPYSCAATRRTVSSTGRWQTAAGGSKMAGI